MSSWRAWLGTRALLIVPVIVAMYGVAWAVQGSAPFFAAAEACPEPSASLSPSASPSGSSPSDAPSGGDDRLSLSFGFQPDPLQPNAAVGWTFSVTNVSDGVVTLTFSSGQDGDVVLSQGGVERYRWSAGRAFTQAIRTIDLGPGEAHHFTLQDTLVVEPGSYDLVATVASEPSPTPATRVVTIGEPSASGGSESPSPDSPSPESTTSPPTTTSPPPTTSSPSDSPTSSPTSSPDASASPFGLIPLVAPRLARDDPTRPRRIRRRGLWAIALALALVAAPIDQVGAQEDAGSGGKNVVIVSNETDGRLAARAGVLQGYASGPSAIPENLASATSSCTDCRTVAVALQAVLIISDPNVASPRNAAVAVNGGCTRCETFAYAWQYVVSTGGPVRVSEDGQQTIADLRAEASSLAGSDLSFPELVVRLDGVARRFRAVIDHEVEPVGGQGIGERALDVEDGC